jgi:hypothetical protein
MQRGALPGAANAARAAADMQARTGGRAKRVGAQEGPRLSALGLHWLALLGCPRLIVWSRVKASS